MGPNIRRRGPRNRHPRQAPTPLRRRADQRTKLPTQESPDRNRERRLMPDPAIPDDLMAASKTARDDLLQLLLENLRGLLHPHHPDRPPADRHSPERARHHRRPRLAHRHARAEPPTPTEPGPRGHHEDRPASGTR